MPNSTKHRAVGQGNFQNSLVNCNTNGIFNLALHFIIRTITILSIKQFNNLFQKYSWAPNFYRGILTLFIPVAQLVPSKKK
jgi:hypothetical protein